MSKVLIYLFAVFALWMYFSFGKFGGESQTMAEKYNVEDFDKAQSGSVGTKVSTPTGNSNFKVEMTAGRNGIGGATQITGTRNGVRM